MIAPRWFLIPLFVLGCGDDPGASSGGDGGTAGNAGSGATSGTGGSGGTSGSGATGGSAGSGGVPEGPVFWVDANAADDSGDGSAEHPKKYIQSGLELFVDGEPNTLFLRDGTYSDSKNRLESLPKPGSSSAWNTIRAEHDGSVELTAGLSLQDDDAYAQFIGLRWHDEDQKSITGSYFKFLRCAFEGGPANGNTVSVAIGTNDMTPGADHVLLEDSWVYGFGGRYKILVYNATNVVLRRVVTRFDGFDPDNIAPEADITVYDSSNVEVQNALAIDGSTEAPSGAYVSAFYNALNGTTATPNENHVWRGSMAIEALGYLMGSEGQVSITGELVEDCASYGGSYGVSQLQGDGTVYRRITVIGAAGDGFGIFGGSADISDSIVASCSGQAFSETSCDNCVAFGNGDNGGGQALDPLKNGLEYLPRIEAGSVLASGGKTGGQRGANITKRIGTSGTLYGEPGFDTVTNEDLWPWPNQDRIRADMAAVSTRGFCGEGETLTGYVFARLGNPSPF